MEPQQQPLQVLKSSKFNYFNVEDRFKGMEIEEIKCILKTESFPGAVAMSNIQGDFNFSSVVRNANAFGISKVFHIGNSRRWDRRGAVGTHNYIDVIHCDSFDMLRNLTQDYSWVALENQIDRNCVSIYNFTWPDNPLLIVGEEGEGLSDQVLDMCEHFVTIPQYGSVRSINVATATGVALNSYASQQALERMGT